MDHRLCRFFLSAILDNLTTTILMVSLLRKLSPALELNAFSCAALSSIAANAGGAWTPIGDVTTTMLWINGQLSSIGVMKSLFMPSIVSLLIPLVWYTFRMKGTISPATAAERKAKVMPWGRLVFYLGVGGLVFVPIFKALTGLPPFMGVILALSVLWLVTDIMHIPHRRDVNLCASRTS